MNRLRGGGGDCVLSHIFCKSTWYIYFSFLQHYKQSVVDFNFIIYFDRHKHKESQADMKLRKVYFYWVCPDTNSFEWINDLLKNFDEQMAEDGHSEFLSYFIYLTRGWDKNQVRSYDN